MHALAFGRHVPGLKMANGWPNGQLHGYSELMSCLTYHNNHKLYHITVMDLCNTITLLILLYITTGIMEVSNFDVKQI